MGILRVYLKITFWSVIVIGIMGYAYFQTRNLIKGAEIIISSPVNGALVREPLLTIEGVANNISFLSINGNQVFIDESNNFKEPLLVSLGYNIITVVAKDKFNKITTKELEVVYKELVQH